MASSFIQVPPDSTGKKLDTNELVVGANTVNRQRVQIGGVADTDLVPVTNTIPAADAPGLVTRIAGLSTPTLYRHANGTSSGAELLSAPGAGLRFRIFWAHLMSEDVTLWWNVLANTNNGSEIQIHFYKSGGGAEQIAPPGGIPWPENQAVYFIALEGSGETWQNITYTIEPV